MSEFHPTKGPWVSAKYSPKRIGIGIRGGEALMFLSPRYGTADCPVMRANIKLMTEAGTTYFETGQTPSQLADQVKVLREALSTFVQFAENHGEVVFSGGGMPAIDAMNRCTGLARVAIAKATGGST